jgi:hypothetical protein
LEPLVSTMRQNKLYILIFLALFSGLGLQAQKKFRPSLNLSGSDQELWNFGVMFGFNQFDITQDLPEGLNIRFTVERNLVERLDLRLEPGIIFEKEPSDKNKQSFTELQLPLLLKYRSNRASNVNPFVLGGYHPAYRLYDALTAEKNLVVHYVEAGFGFDFYLRKSKAALHLRLVKDLSKPSLEVINTSGIFIGFSVETRDGWKLYRQ